VDGLRPLDDDPEAAVADGPEADLLRAGNEDSTDGMAEQSQFAQSAQVGDPVLD
jgi:hypothetical protein